MQTNSFAGVLLTASALKMTTHEELRREVHINALRLGKETNNIIHINMNGFPSLHHQRRSVGSDSVCPPRHPTDIPQMEQVGTPLVPHQPRSVAAVVATAIHGEDIWLPLTIATCPSIAPTWGTDPPLEPRQPLHNTPEEDLLAGTPRMPPPSLEGGQRQSAVFEARTKNPLADEGMLLVIVCLPRHTLTSYEHAFSHLPLLCTCHSTLRPCNIVLQAPCDLSIPWVMELTVHSQDTCHRLMEYQPRGREANLWGFLVNLERRGFGTVWGPPTDTDTVEHTARVAAVEDLKRQLAKVKPRFRHTTKCCVINIGKGNKYNACCIHGEHPLFQGSSLVHNITLRTPDRTLLIIRLTSKKEEVSCGLMMMRRCLIGWLSSSLVLPASVPFPSL